MFKLLSQTMDFLQSDKHWLFKHQWLDVNVLAVLIENLIVKDAGMMRMQWKPKVASKRTIFKKEFFKTGEGAVENLRNLNISLSLCNTKYPILRT